MIYNREYNDVIASGSGTDDNESEQEITYITEVIVALGGESIHMVNDTYDQSSSKSLEDIMSNSFSGDHGYGMTFTLGRGNEIIAKAVESLNPLVIGWDIREVKPDKFDSHYSTSLRRADSALIDAFRSSRILAFTGRKSSVKVIKKI